MREQQIQFGQRLKIAYADYKKMDADDKNHALNFTMQLLQKMLQDGGTQRQKLEELETGTGKKRKPQSHAEKSRAALVRKSNAQSPQPPLEPVKVTKKNELRRK